MRKQDIKFRAWKYVQRKKVLDSIDGLTTRYKNAGLKNFVKTPHNEQALAHSLHVAREPKNTWIFLPGKNSTGKTHLANPILKKTGGTFCDFDDIAFELMDAQGWLWYRTRRCNSKILNLPDACR